MRQKVSVATKSNKERHHWGPPRGVAEDGPTRTGTQDQMEPITETDMIEERIVGHRCSCGREFETKRGMKIHATRMKCVKKEEKEEKIPGFICCCGKAFDSERGLNVHRGRKKCYDLTKGNGNDVKSAKTSSSQAQDNNHSSEASCAPNEESPNSTTPEEEDDIKVEWPKMSDEVSWRTFDEDVGQILSSVSGSLEKRMLTLQNIVYTVAVDRFKKKKKGKKEPEVKEALSRRQKRIGEVKVEKNALRSRWKKCTDEHLQEELKVQFTEVKRKHQALLRAERSAKKRKAKKSERREFMRDPFKYTKKLFTAKTSGKLIVKKEDLDDYLDKTYNDSLKDEELPYMSGLERPTEPGEQFNMGQIQMTELDRFLKKARASSAPGPNGIPYKVYKKCPSIKRFLFRILKTAWNQQGGPDMWSIADGIFIPKIAEASEIGDFRVIAKTNVEGKIFFGIISKRMTDFVLANGFIDTTVQKAGIPGFPGCMEHSAMIWDLIQQTRDEDTDLSVVWLDLANAYGSVPHAAIAFALEFFWIPDHVIKIIMKYLEVYQISFQTPAYRTKNVSVEKGVAAGDTISALLFILVQEIITRATRRFGEVVRCPRVHEVVPSIRGFMDDLTCAQHSSMMMERLLLRLEELISWVRMKFKPKKCRALVMRKGKIVPDSFTIGSGDDKMVMPSLTEQPVKALGRLFTAELSDSDRKKEIKADVEKGLQAIGGCNLQGTLKCWMYQFGLLPRLMWPLIMYEIPVSAVEEMERVISKHLRSWLGVTPSLSSVALYSNSTKLKIPLKSVLEEFKVGKCRTMVAMEESKDPIVWAVQPDLKTGRKWRASDGVRDAKLDIKIEEVVGHVQTNKRGFGYTRRAIPGSTRSQITEKVKNSLEHERVVTACQQASQGRWTAWSAVETRELSWAELWNVSDKRISMMIKSSYDVLGTPANLKRWNLQEDDSCVLCAKSPCNLKHILSGCNVALTGGRYTWRHDKVLKIIAEATECEVARHNLDPVKTKSKTVAFVKKGEKARPRKVSKASIFGAGDDWVVNCDLASRLVVPIDLADTTKRPDIVMISRRIRRVILCELTCPWEENAEWAHERKLEKYEELKNEIESNGWAVSVYAVEVCGRGFASRSLRGYLTAIGCNNKKIKAVVKECCEAAERASVSIYMSRNEQWSPRE